MEEFCKTLKSNRHKPPSQGSEEKEPVRVLVTGAGGLVAYSLLYQLMTGSVLGEDQPLILVLLDIEAMMTVLKGVALELNDCCSPLLKEIIITTDLQTAFKDIDVALLMASVDIINTSSSDLDFLLTHVRIYKQHAEALNVYAKKSVQVIVVAEPSNTLTYVCIRYAPTISTKNITSLMRLYQNRTVAQVGFKLNIPNGHIKNVVIWGNNASNVLPDLMHASISIVDQWIPAPKAIQNDHWIRNELVRIVQNRGAAIAAKRRISNALSTARAVGDQLRDWWYGTKGNEWVNMGVQSDGSYGVEEGLIFGFPVRINDERNYSIVQDLPISGFTRHRIDAMLKENIKERDRVLKLCLELEQMPKPVI